MVNNIRFIDTIPIEFSVNCKTLVGQSVYICGNCPQLGNWNPNQSLKLETNRRNYPQWSTSRPVIIRAYQHVQFKVCIIRQGYVAWQNIPQNHCLNTCSKSSQIYLNFNSIYMEIFQKTAIQIQCRNNTDEVIDDMQSEWGSSIGHPSNYPLTKFHMVKKGELIFEKSQVSSNLISVTDSQEIQFQQRILNIFKPRSLFKTLSKPCDIQRNLSARKMHEPHQYIKTITQSSQKGNENDLKRKIHRSLPKDHNKKLANLTSKCQAINRNSFPLITRGFSIEDKLTSDANNTQTLHTQRRLDFESETVKGSWMSKNTEQNQDSICGDEEAYELLRFQFL